MNDLRENGGRKATQSNRVRKPAQQTRYAPPRGMIDVRKADSLQTVLDTWKQLPLTTRLYFVIIAVLVALLLLLISIRSASLTMSLGFLRDLKGGTASSQETLVSATGAGFNVDSGKPVAIAQMNAELRSGPAASYPVVGLLETGQAAEIVGVSSDGLWWAVSVPYIESGRAWVTNAQVQAHNTAGVEVLAMPAEIMIGVRATANPAIVTALINVNIRSGPGLDFPKIGLLAEGQETEAVGVDADRLWYLVKVPGEENLQGWVSKDYVRVKNGDGLPVVGPKTGTPMLMPLTIVNVRSGPGKDYAIIGSLEKGHGAEIIGVSPDGEWWAIRFASGADGRGWVSAKFVEVENVSDVPVIKL